MSFWSALVLPRVAEPPVITCDSIGAFIERLAATGAFLDDEPLNCQIKYGPRVDADMETTEVVDWDESGIIGTVGDYPWDRSDSHASATALAEALASDDRTVYRAYIGLGRLHPDIVTALSREPSEENEMGMYLTELSFNIGPVLVAGLGSEGPILAGWMDLSLSGPGYFFPWAYRQARDNAEAVGLIGRMVEACRAAWPVSPGTVSDEAVSGRRQLDNLWLYDDLRQPPDWLWFASESG